MVDLQIIRLLIKVSGIVQGVGFRPFVYTIAKNFQLTGFVTNSSEGVIIEVQGNQKNIDLFLSELEKKPPILSQIDAITKEKIEQVDENDFRIKKSESGTEIQTLISPDTSICMDCRKELFDKKDRRYNYPFINCTNCGPRFTIIKDIPYDRPKTTMSVFKMCKQCESEYDDPADRRFHAQPNACPDCGPQVWLEKTGNNEPIAHRDEAIEKAVKVLEKGEILAVKGLGGFHLMVDASNANAVKKLRTRKHREEKALAIMVPDLEIAKSFCHLSESSAELLSSYQSPIVILKKKSDIAIADEVAPNNPNLGIMLPYTPLHQLILSQFEKLNSTKSCALVATSGNITDEPIAITNDDGRERLQDIADYLLLNDRDILVRSDDSVVAIINDKPVFYRRSRGFAPKPIQVKSEGPSILGTGADLKNAICILKNNEAFVSQHIGDMENLLANNFFKNSISHMQRITSTKPDIIAHDMHPGYSSSHWATNQTDKKLIPVQHHHAHMASVMAEYGINNKVMGIILDGTGYGYDKTIWGGEIFAGDYTHLKREAWLEPMPLPGGDAAIKHPWRIAVAYLYMTFGKEYPVLPFMDDLPVPNIVEMVEKKINTIHTSSCGRLFDAVAAMSGGQKEVHYEAQAAIEMMNRVDLSSGKDNSYPIILEDHDIRIPVKKIVTKIVEDIQNNVSFSEISTRFHNTLISIFTELTLRIRKKTQINSVVLSGGVFQNEILLNGLWKKLEENDFVVFVPEIIPVNDGGISLGQTVIARHLLEENLDSVIFETA